jgi:hypothetical protein
VCRIRNDIACGRAVGKPVREPNPGRFSVLPLPAEADSVGEKLYNSRVILGTIEIKSSGNAFRAPAN